MHTTIFIVLRSLLECRDIFLLSIVNIFNKIAKIKFRWFIFNNKYFSIKDKSMNMNSVTNVTNSINFNGGRSYIRKVYNNKTKTMQDVLELRKTKNVKPFEYTYDKLIKSCEIPNKNAAAEKRAKNFFSALNIAIKKQEIEKKTFNNFLAVRDKYIYNQIIKRCFSDIDNAVLNNEQQSKIDELVNILEMFTKKYSHYDKLS